MKKRFYLLMFAVFGMLASCSNDDITDGNVQKKPKRVFMAETEMPADTRTLLNPDNYVLWTWGDHISIFDQSPILEEYELTEGAGTNMGKFSYIENPFDGDFQAGTELNDVIAIYPHNTNNKVTYNGDGSYLIPGSIPLVQNYEEHTLPYGALPMVAVSKDNNLKFKNMGAIIELKVKSAVPNLVLHKISINSKEKERLFIGGRCSFTVYADGKEPNVKVLYPYQDVVALDCNKTVLSDTDAKTFRIAVAPTNFVNGFTITLFTDKGVSQTFEAKPTDLKRNQLLAMPEIVFAPEVIVPELPSHVEWVDLGLPSGTKWANCNVGAEYPEDSGILCAFGEMTTKTKFSEVNYAYCKIAPDGINFIYEEWDNISGNPEYDIATARWGESARTPTNTEMQELMNADNCSWTWTTQNGVDGYLVKSKRNENSIFLPNTGYFLPGSYYDDSTLYRTSTTNYSFFTYALCMQSTSYFIDDTAMRVSGEPVRAVSN